MNFEANYLSNYRQYKPYPPQNCSTVRIKTWNDDIVQDDMSNKRFKRSQSKTFKFNNNTCYPNQSFQAGSFRVKKNVPCEKPDRANNSYNFQSVKETNSEVTQVWRQKCLTQPIYFHKTPLNKNNIECQSPKTTYLDNLSASQCHPFEGNANDMYPLRFITPNLYPQNSQINDKNMNYSYVKRDDFVKRDVSINLQNRCQNQTLKVKYKQVDENKNMLNLADTKYNSLVNLSTESSIHTNQIKNTKKITTSTQTQNKKTVAMAINTISNRCNSIKIQTDETMSSIQKLNESMKNKIECLEGENKKLKAELVCANKQKQQLKKQINQKKQPFQKKANLKTLACVKSKEKLQIIGDTKEKQSLKDTTLFSLVQNLKQEITVLKQGYGLKKIEQILQNVKRENALLSNQLQAVSLKCRVLEQQNSQYTTVEQQNRRIKLQMRYMRAGMKDYKLELDRLKGQNQKLRDNKMIKKAGNGIEESKVFTNWGSETDSLCLSISFAGE